MARLWSSGFELNSTTLEGTTNGVGSSIVTSPVRSGTYAWRQNHAASQGLSSYIFKASNTADGFYFRTYIRIADGVANDTQIFCSSAAAGQRKVVIRLTASNTLQLYNQEDGAQIGSDSSALSNDTWYRLELKVDCTTLSSTSTEARIDGVAFASGTVNLAAGLSALQWGVANNNETADIYFDDMAINDDSGSFQNSYPGAGEIIHLKPNAVGDNSDWTPTAGDNYTNVDEVTPDDATTTVTNTSVVSTIDDYNLEASGLSGKTITLIQVGVRIRQNEIASSDKVRVKATASGTVEASANISQVDTSWHTNAAAAPFNYPLTLYDLPGASTTAWTSTELDTAQIGVEHTGGVISGSDVSTMWLLVDFTDPVATTSTSTTSTSSSTTTSSSTSTTSTSTSTSRTTSTSTTSTSTSTSRTTSTSTTSTSSSTSTSRTTSTSTTLSLTTSTSTTSSSTSTTSTSSSTSTSRTTSTSTTSTSSSTSTSRTTSTSTTSTSTTSSTSTSRTTSTSTTSTSSSTSTTSSITTSTSTSISTSTTMTINYPIMVQKGIQ